MREESQEGTERGGVDTKNTATLLLDVRTIFFTVDRAYFRQTWDLSYGAPQTTQM